MNKIQGKLSDSKFASQGSTNFNELSKSKVNIPLYGHNIDSSNIGLLVQEGILVTFFHFQTRFSIAR